MVVTAIQRTKRGRFSVFLDGEFYCALHGDVFSASSLTAGGVVSLEEMEALHRASEGKITRERALKLLGQRSYTRQGLCRKLRERTDEDCARAAVERMAELGLVDDWDYARRYAADCINLKGFSHRRTAQELARKGIDREIIDQVLGEREEEPEPAIARVILRRYLGSLQDEKGRQKTVGALVRRGYRYEEIRAVINNLLEDENYYREWD